MQARSWVWALLWLSLSSLSVGEEELSCSPPDQPHAVRGLYARRTENLAALAGVPHSYEANFDESWIETRELGIYARNDQKDPLEDPGRVAKDKTPFIRRKLAESQQAGTFIGIVPDPRQIQTWIMDKTAISTTAQWHKFDTHKITLSMSGLTGCTGVFVMTQYGVWGAHIWEEDPHFNYGGAGGAGHMGWYRKNKKDSALPDDPERMDEQMARPEEHFQQIALDIMHKKTKQFEGLAFKSFPDLKSAKQQPFTSKMSGSEAKVLIFSRQPPGDGKKGTFKYAAHLELLKKELLASLPGLSIQDITTQSYRPLKDGDPTIDGVVIIEYTPYEDEWEEESKNGKKQKGCRKKARARIWAEPHHNDNKPVFEMNWPRG